MGLNLEQDVKVVLQQLENLLLPFLQGLPAAVDYTLECWSNHEELWGEGMVELEGLLLVPVHLEGGKMQGQLQKQARLQMRTALRLIGKRGC